MILLKGYRNILQTNGYAAYNKAVKEYGLWHVGCLTHARRKFYILENAEDFRRLLPWDTGVLEN